MSLKNLSVGKKLLFGFGLVIVLIAIILCVTLGTSIQRNKQLAKIESMSQLQDEANILKEEFLRARIELRTVYTSSGQDAVESYRLASNSILNAIARLDNIQQIVAGLPLEDQAIYGEINTVLGAMFDDIVRNVDGIHQNDLAIMEASTRMLSAFNDMSTAATQLYDAAEDILIDMIQETPETAQRYINNVISPTEDMILDMAGLRVNASYLILNLDTNMIGVLEEELTKIQKTCTDIRSHLSSQVGIQAAETVQNAIAVCFQEMEDTGRLIQSSQQLIAQTRQLTSQLDDSVDAGAQTIEAEVTGLLRAMALSSVFTMTLQSIIVLIAIAISIAVGLTISRSITKPLLTMKNVLVEAGETGNMAFDEDTMKHLQEEGAHENEIAHSIRAFSVLLEHIVRVSDCLTRISKGDLTVHIKPLSEKDTMSNALESMTDNLNSMFQEISNVAMQVTGASNEIAQGSQILAQGSTEQAATIEEISASVSQIDEQMTQASQTSDDAAKLGNQISAIAQEGSHKMDEMMKATQEISDASSAIERVIKVIDDIAFQTNILALNAAVEAARAGQHGKGFAVVADEVRNLAGKSAEAARETTNLISTNIEKTQLGLSISQDTADNLAQIIEGIQASSQSIQALALQTQQAKHSTGEVNQAIEQVAHVVHQNSATSEQSAAASQQMNSQAQILQQLLRHFTLRDSSAKPGKVSVSPPIDAMRL